MEVIINNFNRLSSTRALVEKLQSIGYTQLHILDNGSTYAPLLDYYEQLKGVTVVRLPNTGPRALWDSGYIHQFEGWIAYTDADIELHPDTPPRFLENMIRWTESLGHKKGGLALRLDDLTPEHFGHRWKEWEGQFWKKEILPGIYEADVDTTFCVMRAEEAFDYRALRFAEYPARHLPWYTPANFQNLSEEEAHYLQNATPDSTYSRCYQESLK